jgi:hypothetical protein
MTRDHIIEGLILIAGIALIVLGFWGVGKLISKIPGPPKCLEYRTEYYWTSWAGNRYFVGSDFELAREMAGSKPLSQAEMCVTWSR